MYTGRTQAKKPFYVSVTAIHYITGVCCPQVLEFPEGKAIMIEDVKKVQKLSGKDNDGAEERYLINLKGKEKYLYRRGQRWYIYPQKGDLSIFGTLPNDYEVML